MMAKKEKCLYCRTAKQKCTPEERRWDPVVQDRCTNCIKWNKPCTANEKPPDRQQQENEYRLLEGNHSRSAGLPTAFEMTRENMESSLGSAERKHTNLTSNSKELMKSLEELEALAEYVNQVQSMIKKVEGNGVYGYNTTTNSPQFADLTKVQKVTTQNLVKMLYAVEIFADQAQMSGEIHLAENTYMRVLDIYQRQLPHFGYSIARQLEKLGSFYWSLNQPLRAQKCWWDILETLDPHGEAHCIKQNAWKRLHITLPKTSRIISKAFQSRNSNELNLETPFPPLQTMMKSDYASNGPHEKVGNDSFLENTTASAARSMITPDVGNLAELIRSTPDEDPDLETRDMWQRTPLFLAASMKQEDTGYALVERMAKLPSADQERHVNARDVHGQTILGAATEAGCSVDFVKVLIERGASVDPSPLTQFPLTPLQAACMTSNVELVDLFLRHDACIDRAFDGHASPLELAEYSSPRIAQLIGRHAKARSENTAPKSAVDNGPYTHIDASRNNVFAEWDIDLEDQITIENDLGTGSS